MPPIIYNETLKISIGHQEEQDVDYFKYWKLTKFKHQIIDQRILPKNTDTSDNKSNNKIYLGHGLIGCGDMEYKLM